jgi:hypothetical protein
MIIFIMAVFQDDLHRPVCHSYAMIRMRFTPMHHLTIVVSSVASAGYWQAAWP